MADVTEMEIRQSSGTWTDITVDDEVLCARHASGTLVHAVQPAIKGMEWSMTVHQAAPGTLVVESRLTNRSEDPAPLHRVTVLEWNISTTAEAFTLCYRHGQHLIDPCRMVSPNERPVSHGCVGLTDARGTNAFVAGFTDLADAFCTFEIDGATPETVHVRAVCDREGIACAPGETLRLPALTLSAGSSLEALLRQYAAQVVERLKSNGKWTIAPLEGGVETGWCSWYYYYGTETEADILENVEALAASSLGEHVRVIQIDDGWNVDGVNGACVWGDWWPGTKFPDGMAEVARRIREAGFVPGLWLAPFSVAPTSRLRQDHSDWLVQHLGADGAIPEPALYWGRHALDLTHPEVLRFLRETFDRVFNGWGYEYVKLDFLLHAVQPGLRYNRTVMTAQAYRQALAVIREVAGDRFILGCGAPLGPSVGLCDGMRIGNDVSTLWESPESVRATSVGMCTVRAAATQTIQRQWMHGIWWRNDPDCLVVRDYGSAGERAMFSTYSGGLIPDDMPYGLNEEEAGFWVRLVWLTGGMALISERIGELSNARMALLERAFPVNSQPARLVDWYENPDVAVMVSQEEMPRVGIFNMTDVTQTVALPSSRLGVGESWAFREKISDEWFAGEGDTVRFPPIPAHGGRIWSYEGR